MITFDSVYLKGVNLENEDAFVANIENKVFAVIDGATGLGGFSGKLASTTIQESLSNILFKETLINCLLRGNEKISKFILESLKVDSIDLIPKEDRSTCGVAAIKINNQQVEYVHAGDCMIFIEYENGEFRQVTYDHLSKLDSISIEKFHTIMKSIIDDKVNIEKLKEEEIFSLLKRVRSETLPFIIENRRRLNTENGYGIFDGSDDVINYLDYGVISIFNAKRILLLSDGLQLPSLKGSGYEVWNKTASFAFKYGLEALKDEVINLELSDKICYKYPRLKYADDKTGLLINLK